MNIEYIKQYSTNLKSDMEFKIWGNSGEILLVFPAQNGRFYDFEDNGMMDCLLPLIESKQIQVVEADGIDIETWSSQGDARWRIEQHENYYNYIIEELIPFILKKANKDLNDKILVTGCSMGASHALNFFLRRPDIFKGVIALSGIYHASYFFNNYMDDLVYNNSPINYLANMPINHPYVTMYQKSDIILCVGQGAHEQDMIIDTRIIEKLLKDKNIDCWIDYWGYDVSHDWYWWQKQLPYFLDTILNKKNI